MEKGRKKNRVLIILLVVALIELCAFIVPVIIITIKNTMQETTDINEYGNWEYTDKDGGDVKKYTDNIMPRYIEDFFSVVHYSYRWKPIAQTHEAYLEITIEDETQYQSYVQQLTAGKETTPFFYNNAFEEYVYTDILSVSSAEFLEKSEVQKVLFSDETNTLIFVSFVHLIYDEVQSVKELYYFERFDIDVTTYYDGMRIRTQTNQLPYKYRYEAPSSSCY